MDKLKVYAMLDGTMTPIVIEAEHLESVQLWSGGKFQARMRGATYDGMPVTYLQLRQAEMVLAYMDRRETKNQ